MAQLTYSIEHRPAIASGDFADSNLTHRVEAVRNNLATDLPFGLMLASDQAAAESANPTVNPIAGNHQAVKLPDSKTVTLIGVSVRSAARAPGIDGFDVNGARPNNVLDCVTMGKVYVAPEAAVAPSDGVYARFGTSGVAGGPTNAQRGQFGKTADVVAAWAKKTAYTPAGIRVALNGKVYKLVTPGTSEDSDTPALTDLTGTALADGTAVWDYIGTCDVSSRESAVLVSNARWAKGSLDLAPNLPAYDAFGTALPARLAVLEIAKP